MEHELLSTLSLFPGPSVTEISTVPSSAPYVLSTRLGLPTTNAQSESLTESSSDISTITTPLAPAPMSSTTTIMTSASLASSIPPITSSTPASAQESYKHKNIGLIIGCAIGGGVPIILVFVALAFFLMHRRRSRAFTKVAEIPEAKTLEIQLPLFARVLNLARCMDSRMTQFQILDIHQSARGSIERIEDGIHGGFMHEPLGLQDSMQPSLGEGNRNPRHRNSDSSTGTISGGRDGLEGVPAGGETPRARSLNSAKASSTFLGEELSFILNIQGQVVTQMERATVGRAYR